MCRAVEVVGSTGDALHRLRSLQHAVVAVPAGIEDNRSLVRIERVVELKARREAQGSEDRGDGPGLIQCQQERIVLFVTVRYVPLPAGEGETGGRTRREHHNGSSGIPCLANIHGPATLRLHVQTEVGLPGPRKGRFPRSSECHDVGSSVGRHIAVSCPSHAAMPDPGISRCWTRNSVRYSLPAHDPVRPIAERRRHAIFRGMTRNNNRRLTRGRQIVEGRNLGPVQRSFVDPRVIDHTPEVIRIGSRSDIDRKKAVAQGREDRVRGLAAECAVHVDTQRRSSLVDAGQVMPLPIIQVQTVRHDGLCRFPCAAANAKRCPANRVGREMRGDVVGIVAVAPSDDDRLAVARLPDPRRVSKVSRDLQRRVKAATDVVVHAV